jgi:hypothetical protein
MPYDKLLAKQVRRAFEDRTDMVEKAMFGGLAFMASANMCCEVNRDDVIIRLDARTTAEQRNSPQRSSLGFHVVANAGMFAVSGQGSAEQGAVDKWVKLALNHATALPAKIKGPKSRGASRAKPSPSRGKKKKVMECQPFRWLVSHSLPLRGANSKMPDSARVMEERTSVGPQVREFSRVSEYLFSLISQA